MEPLALTNIAAYTAQVICVVALGSAVLWLLRMDVAVVRYAYWRALLALCIVLPLLQGRHTAGAENDVSVAVGVAQPVALGTLDGAVPPALEWTSFIVPLLAVGAALRLLWLGASLLRLRWLRRLGYRFPESEIQTELQAIIGTKCEIRYVERLKQPVTFGLWHPVILLPAVLAESEPDMQRAVLSHELFHVKRRDWAWLVGEEIVCALLWFNPAVWWMVSRVQLAREVVVDELVVLATGRRRAYVEALIAFADETSLAPAAAFGSRRQLFNRIVLLSKEGVMSSHRLVFTCAVMAAVVMMGSWRAIRAFPLTAAPEMQVVQQKAPGPLEQRANPITPENPIPRRIMYEAPLFPAEARDAGARGSVTLMITLDEVGRVAEARSVGLTLTSRTPPVTLTRRGGNPDPEARVFIEGSAEQSHAVRAIAAAFTDSAIRAVGQWRYDPPAAGPISFPVTVNFSETGGATAVQGAAVKRLVTEPGTVRADGAIRVGGNVRTPIKTRDVRPIYPAEAQAARISGVVILEVRISPEGLVEDARVLRSIPMLDQAAIDAVMQWRFRPTLLNGRSVPVIMTVTVNFVLDPHVSVSPEAVVPEGRRLPEVVKEVKPVYPSNALHTGVQGTVEVEVTIGTDGTVVDSRVIRSIPMLDDAALAAVQQWRFRPPSRPVVTTIELTFSTKRNGGGN
jgi:TonB family protein